MERKQPLTTAPLSLGAVKRAGTKAPKALTTAGAMRIVLSSLDESKAEDIVSIDITGKSPMADAMVIASGRSNRHVGAIAERLVEDLKKAGSTGIRAEGLAHCDWVLIDAGDILVHIFRPEVRGFYNLEKMWTADPVGAPVAV